MDVGLGKEGYGMWRVLDANFNRLGEALRVLEDISRFILEEKDLTERFRLLRHGLTPRDPFLKAKFLHARDSAGDVGRGVERSERRDEVAVALANARRVQESLRVIEELSKLPEVSPHLDQDKFSQARFTFYELEKELFSRLQRRQKRERIRGLYLILDCQAARGRDEVKLARQAILGGVRLIQLRDKERSSAELLPLARKLQQLCAESSVLFLVNDRVDLALGAEADGVHLGPGDFPVQEARKLLPWDKLIGCSVKTLAQARRAAEEGADYVSVGSIYPSPTKPQAKVVGLDLLRQTRGELSLPLVAIGGIGPERVAEVLTAGADAVAVVSAVLQAEDVTTAVRELVQKIEEAS